MRETVIADSTNYWLNVMLALGLGTDLQMVSVPRSPLTPQIPSYRLQTQKTSSKKKKKKVRNSSELLSFWGMRLMCSCEPAFLLSRAQRD